MKKISFIAFLTLALALVFCLPIFAANGEDVDWTTDYPPVVNPYKSNFDMFDILPASYVNFLQMDDWRGVKQHKDFSEKEFGTGIMRIFTMNQKVEPAYSMTALDGTSHRVGLIITLSASCSKDYEATKFSGVISFPLSELIGGNYDLTDKWIRLGMFTNLAQSGFECNMFIYNKDGTMVDVCGLLQQRNTSIIGQAKNKAGDMTVKIAWSIPVNRLPNESFNATKTINIEKLWFYTMDTRNAESYLYNGDRFACGYDCLKSYKLMFNAGFDFNPNKELQGVGGIWDYAKATAEITVAGGQDIKDQYVNLPFEIGIGTVYFGELARQNLRDWYITYFKTDPGNNLSGISNMIIHFEFSRPFDLYAIPLYLENRNLSFGVSVSVITTDGVLTALQSTTTESYLTFHFQDEYTGSGLVSQVNMTIGNAGAELDGVVISTNSSFYLQGYEKGYNEAVTSDPTGLEQKGYDSGFETGKNTGYQDGYSKGFKAGTAASESGDFKSLIFAVVDTPVNVFKSMLNFDILGFNILQFATGLLTLCLVVAVIKRFLL